MIARRLLLVLTALGWFATAAAAEEPVRLERSDVERNIGRMVEYYRDPGRELTIDDVRSMPFSPHEYENLSVGFTSDAVWLRFSVDAEYEEPRAWFIEIDHPLHDEVELYSETPDGGWRRTVNGDSIPAELRALDLRTIVFPIEIPPRKTSTYYVRIMSGNSIVAPVSLVDQTHYLVRTASIETGFGVFYGALLIMALFNLALYASLRDTNYLLYFAAVVSTTLFQATLSGHALQYLYPRHEAWNNTIQLFALIGTIGFGLWFSIGFLETRRNVPAWHWTMVVLIAAAVGLAPLDWAAGYSTAIRTGAMLSVIGGLVALGAGVWCLRLHVYSAKFYVLARTGFCVGSVLTAGRQLGLFPDGFITENGMRIGSLLESVLLAFALSDRYNRLRAEKEAAQRKMAEELQRLDKLKDEILANTSHELRTPLHGIIGLTESMLDGAAGAITEAARRNLSLIASAGRRLARLVDDILDFSRLKTHDLRLNVRPLDLRVAVDVVTTLMQPLVRDRPLELINDVDESLPPVLADESRVQQVLNNLIGNALKFTDDGEVRVRAQPEDGLVRIDIVDTGIGIDESVQERIFESFEQADGGDARARGGTGLGLSVTRQLVELQGGTISVRSAPGAGSTFSFTLPVSAEAVDPAAAPTADPRANGEIPQSTLQAAAVEAFEIEKVELATDDELQVHVLVVDDEPINQQVLTNHLSTGNYRVTQAMNGAEALRHLESRRKFDLVLLDVMMPRMSGYEVCERIRKTYLATELPVIMVTAKTQTDDLVTGLSVGANDYVAKPFAKQELLARIKTHLNLLRINNAYGKFVPHEFLRQLGKESIIDVELGDNVEIDVAVMMSDIRGFTTLFETLAPGESFNFINDYFGRMGPVIREHGGFINSFVGDAIMALFVDGAAAAVAAAVDSSQRLDRYNEERSARGQMPIDAGFGVHLGRARLGIVGEVRRRQGEVFSDAINLASRIESLTKQYGTRLIISGDVYACVAANAAHSVRFLGTVRVKGRTRPVDLYEVLDCAADRTLREASRAAFEAGVHDLDNGDAAAAQRRFAEVLGENPDDRTAAYFSHLAGNGRS